MDLEKDGNLIEAGLWFAFTVVLLAKALKGKGVSPRIRVCCSSMPGVKL